MGPELLSSTQGDLTLQNPNPQEKEQSGKKLLDGQWGRKFFWTVAEVPRLLQTRSSYGCILVSPYRVWLVAPGTIFQIKPCQKMCEGLQKQLKGPER